MDKISFSTIGAKSLLLLIMVLTAGVFKSSEVAGQESPNTKKLKMTSLAYGGTGVLFTRVNNQFTLMNGGRGAAVFNNRYTFGGGGWGMSKGIELKSAKEDTLEYFKFGYGGLEFGYIIYPGAKLKIGSNLLLAYGGGFKETVPKSDQGSFKMFPVLEPSVYTHISLGKLFRLDFGITYRLVQGTKFSYISNRQLSGFSCYVALLAGTCKCDN